MKKSVLFLFGLCFSLFVFGQTQTNELEEVKVTPPKFAGVENIMVYLDADNSMSINNYLAKNIFSTRAADNVFVEGTEIVQFTITASGKVADFKIVNSIGREIDREVIRVLEKTDGMWKPGYNNGEPMSMEKEISISFGDYKKEAMVERFTHIATNDFKKGGINLFENDKPKKALKAYNHGMRYLPNDKSLLVMRGLCHYELGNMEDAKRDWERIVTLGGLDLGEFHDEMAEMSGYSEMNTFLARSTE